MKEIVACCGGIEKCKLEILFILNALFPSCLVSNLAVNQYSEFTCSKSRLLFPMLSLKDDSRAPNRVVHRGNKMAPGSDG